MNRFIFTPWMKAVVSALVVFCTGFVALNCFWVFGSHDSNLPGLYSYCAATWGDGLFLTSAAFGLVGFCSSVRDRVSPSVRERADRFGIALGIVAALAGAAIQASWLLNNDIDLNWTIPQTHVFNAAGWYHALFLIASFGFFFGMLGEYLKLVSRNALPADGEYSYWEEAYNALIWFGSVGYVQMHMIDDHADLLSQPWLTLFVGVAFVIVLILVFAFRVNRGHRFRFGAVCVPGILGAVGISLYVGYLANYFAIAWLFCFGFVLVGLMAVTLTEANIRAVVLEAELLALSNTGLAFIAMSAGVAWPFGIQVSPLLSYSLLFGTLFLLALINMRLSWKRQGGGDVRLHRFSLSVLIVAAGLVLTAAIAMIQWDGSLQEILFAIFEIGLVGICVSRFKEEVEFVQEREFSSGNGSIERLVSYSQMCIVCFGLLLLSIPTLLNFHRGVTDSFGGIGIFSFWTIVVLVACILFATIPMIICRVLQKPAIRVSAVCSAISYGLLVFLAFSFRTSWAINFLFVAYAPFLSISVSLFIGESFLSNCYLLRGRSVPKGGKSSVIPMIVGSSAATVCCVFPADSADTILGLPIIPAAASGLFMLLGYVVIPSLLSLSTYQLDDLPARRLIKNKPIGGIAQNGMAALAISTLVGVLVLNCVHSVLTKGVITLDSLRFVGIAIVTVCGCFFPLSMNSGFISKALKEYRALNVNERIETVEELNGLCGHFARQGHLAVVVLIPWSLFKLIPKFYGRKRCTVRDRLLEKYTLALEPDLIRAVWSEALSGRVSKNKLSPIAERVIKLLGKYRGV